MVLRVRMSENILQKVQDSQERFFNQDRLEIKSLHHSTPCTPYFLHTILQTIHDGILFVNLDGLIITINEPAHKTLSMNLLLNEKKTTSSLIGQRYEDLFPDEFFGFSMKEALNFGISHKLLYRSYANKKLEITTLFLYEGQKPYQGLLISFRDISEKERLQEIIHRGERMKKLGEMVASISHEIRNTLGGIRGFASLLFRDLSGQKHLQEMANVILEGTKTAERLVSQILQYAKPIQIEPQSTEIGQFLRHWIKAIKLDPAYPRSIDIKQHLPEEPLIAPIDLDAMRSALLNLVLNAFQAMPLGGVLTFSLLKSDSCYQIAISDTGIGMDDNQLKQIFSPFFTTKEQGNGLGLAQVQKIIQAHYGTIDVRSTVSKGTTFTLTLPLKRG